MTRVLVAGSHCLHRQALAIALAAESDLAVVAEDELGEAAADRAGRVSPDVVIVDVEPREGAAIEAISSFRDRVPAAAVVLLAPELDEELLVGAVESGAAGCLPSTCSLAELIAGIRAARLGEVVIPRALVGKVVSRLVSRRRDRDAALERLARLTQREREVLVLLTKIGDTARIAEALVISPETARTHIRNVLAKLEVHSRVEALAFVLQHGILQDLQRAAGLVPPPDERSGLITT